VIGGPPARVSRHFRILYPCRAPFRATNVMATRSRRDTWIDIQHARPASLSHLPDVHLTCGTILLKQTFNNHNHFDAAIVLRGLSLRQCYKSDCHNSNSSNGTRSATSMSRGAHRASLLRDGNVGMSMLTETSRRRQDASTKCSARSRTFMAERTI